MLAGPKWGIGDDATRLARFLFGHHLLYKFSPASRIDKMPRSRVICFSFLHKKRDCHSEICTIKL